MALIDLYCLHFEVWQPAFTHEEMNGRYKVSQIRIDTDVVMKNLLKMNNVVLIGLFVNIFNRHLGVKVLIEIQVALSIMIDSSFA